MIIWRGWGILAPLLLLCFFGCAQSIDQSLIGKSSQYASYFPLAEGFASILGAIVCWFLGRYLNSKKIIIIDEATGKVKRARARHSCWFIPFEYWSVVGVIMAFLIII